MRNFSTMAGDFGQYDDSMSVNYICSRSLPDRRIKAHPERYDFLIVEDDYEFEMNFLESPTPAFKSRDSDGRVIYVGSLSKSVFPGLHLAQAFNSLKI